MKMVMQLLFAISVMQLLINLVMEERLKIVSPLETGIVSVASN
jgi:hypothetical protein